MKILLRKHPGIHDFIQNDPSDHAKYLSTNEISEIMNKPMQWCQRYCHQQMYAIVKLSKRISLFENSELVYKCFLYNEHLHRFEQSTCKLPHCTRQSQLVRKENGVSSLILSK